MQSQQSAQRSAAERRTADAVIQQDGSICLLHPMTDRADAWIDANVNVPAYMRFGAAIAMETRFVAEIVDAMTADGLRVR